jgi:hypothetical protein
MRLLSGWVNLRGWAWNSQSPSIKNRLPTYPIARSLLFRLIRTPFLCKHLFLASRPCDAVNGDVEKKEKEKSARSSVSPLPFGFRQFRPQGICFYFIISCLHLDGASAEGTEQDRLHTGGNSLQIE